MATIHEPVCNPLNSGQTSHHSGHCVRRRGSALILLLLIGAGMAGQCQTPAPVDPNNPDPNNPDPNNNNPGNLPNPGFQEIAKLLGEGIEHSEQFGKSVDIDGDRIVTGTPFPGQNDGRAFVYRRRAGQGAETWELEQELIQWDLANDQNVQFGTSVAIQGDMLMVGAVGHDDPRDSFIYQCGGVYIFKFNGTEWVELEGFVADDAAIQDYFGSAVDFDGDTAIIGAFGRPRGGQVLYGKAYVYQFVGNSWEFEQELQPTDGTTPLYFGADVAVDGDTIAVAANNANYGTGEVYVYRLKPLPGPGGGGPKRRELYNWQLEQKITAFDGEETDGFGGSVSLDGNTLVVGASNKKSRDDVGSLIRNGKVYIYTRQGTTWTLQQSIVPEAEFSYFGFDVALVGDRFVTTSTPQDTFFVFDRDDDGDWHETQRLVPDDAEPNDGPLALGEALAFDGTTAAAGAVGKVEDEGRVGAVYIFKP